MLILRLDAKLCFKLYICVRIAKSLHGGWLCYELNMVEAAARFSLLEGNKLID